MDKYIYNKKITYLKSYWISFLIFVPLCLLAISICWIIDFQEKSDLRKKVEIEAQKISTYITKDIDHRINSLNRSVSHWQMHKGYSKNDFTIDAQDILAMHPGFQAIEWVDSTFHVRWIVPFAGNEKAQGLNLAFEKERRIALEKAQNSKSPTVTSPIELVQGGKGFLIYFPLYMKGEFDGFLIAVFRAHEWLNYLFSSTEDPTQFDNFRLAISFDDELIFKHKNFENYIETDFDVVRSLIIHGHRITIHCRPSKTFITNEKTFIPQIAVAFGIIMSALISIMVALVIKANNESYNNLIATRSLKEEITKKQTIEDSLKETTNRLSLAVNAGKVGIWDWDISTNKVTWNNAMYDIYDIPTSVSPTFETWENLLNHDDKEKTLALLKDAVAGKSAFDTEYRINLSDGRIINIHASAKVERDDHGNPVRMTGVNWDISNLNFLKKQIEMQKILMKVSAKYINTPINDVSSTINDALAEIGNYVCADRAYIFDYDFENQTTSNTYEWCNNNIAPHILELQQLPLKGLSDWVNTHKSGLPIIIADVNSLPDGQLKEMLVPQKIKSLITVPMQFENNTIGFIGFDWVLNYNSCPEEQANLLKLLSQILANIRMRLTSEEQLLESRNRLDLAIIGTKAGLWDWEIQTGKVVFNERWAEIVGYTLNELEPLNIQTWMDLCHPEDLKLSNHLIQDHFDGKTELYEFEARMKHKNGEWVWVLDRGKVVEWDNNKPLRMTGTHIDITERKQYEKLKEEIERMIHHDLKNPLNNIMMLQHILKESPDLTEKERKAVKYTEIAGNQMQRMLDMHLDLFKIETGSYKFEPKKIDIIELIKKIISDEMLDEDQSSVKINIFINDDSMTENKTIFVNAEEHLCYNIISNLINNAKQAPNSNNSINIFINETDTVDIIIHNDAPVPESIRENFFSKYSTEGKKSGTGLGTYSAKLLAEAQGATIAMDSTEEDGTKVIVSFPKLEN